MEQSWATKLLVNSDCKMFMQPSIKRILYPHIVLSLSYILYTIYKMIVYQNSFCIVNFKIRINLPIIKFKGKDII